MPLKLLGAGSKLLAMGSVVPDLDQAACSIGASRKAEFLWTPLNVSTIETWLATKK